MDAQKHEPLIRQTEESYGESFKKDLLEQYKLYLQSAENVGARRVASSRYMLTLNGALVALYGIQSANFGQSYWTLLLPVVGISASALWYLIIKSHADLNSVKFKVIQELEQLLYQPPCTGMSGSWRSTGRARPIARSPASSSGSHWYSPHFTQALPL